MITMKRISFVLLCMLALISCKKEESTEAPAATNTTGGGGGGGGFTPPTANMWKINGTANGGSMDAVNVNIAGTNMGVSKPFPDLGYGYCQLRIFSDNNTLDIRSEVPEGGYKAYDITTGSTWDNQMFSVEVDVQDQGGEDAGYYFYRVTSGKVYVSKKNGLLRYTGSGVFTMEGVKYPDMSSYTYSATVEFSQEESD
jgi:hypothetical protein